MDTSPPAIEKFGAEARLSDNADTWPQEILKELVKQHPYVGVYEVSPNMIEVNGDRGYGLAYFQITNSSPISNIGPGGEALAKHRGVKTVRIPAIIKENKLQPIDVLITEDGNTLPLSEERLSESMYRPQLFDRTAKSPGDVSILEQLYPPVSRQYGTGAVVSAPIHKISHDQSLLHTILPTMTTTALSKIKQAFEQDHQLLRSLCANDAAKQSMELIGKADPTTTEDVAKVAAANIQPDTVQIERRGEKYILKTAASQCFHIHKTAYDRPSAVDMAGEDLVEAADRFGSSTISTDPVVREEIEDEEVAPIDRFGEYRVKTIDGKEMLGWVFPTVLDYDGTALTMSIFTNGSLGSVQEKIVGSLVGKSSNIIRSKPEGYGFFYRVTDSGSVVAFVPTEITSAFSDELGSGYIGKTMLDSLIRIRFVKGLQEITQMGDDEVALPHDVRWAPIGEHITKLIDNPDAFVKVAHIQQRDNTVEIVSDSRSWSFRGGANIQKLANDQRESLGGHDAIFLATAVGMSPDIATKAIVKAAKLGSIKVSGCRSLHFPEEKLAAARQISKELWSDIPNTDHLLKEAAGLDDATTVDTVLSLGFLNPENVQSFIEYIPDLEDSVSKLAKLLITTRLGLKDVPEFSVKSAMERLEEVISGLKKLLMRQGSS